MSKRRCATVALAVALVLATPTAARATVPGVTFDFDSGEVDATWTSGCLRNGDVRGCLKTTKKAVVHAISRANGTAIRFPDSGSAVIRVPHDDALNPGRADFTITAKVRLASGQVKSGANIIQKGRYDNARGQWKLQVDHGVPSCRVFGRAERKTDSAAEVEAPHRVPNDTWTTLRCTREGSTLRLYVDGKRVDSAGNADIDIRNSDPVLIGGKHSGTQNDQFRGDLDDVGVDIS